MSVTTRTSGSGADLTFTRSWLTPDPLANVVLVHGINEHSGRYHHVGEQFNAAGLNVVAPDLPGFGESGGPRAYVPTWETFLDRIEPELAALRAEGLPLILYGHSMGGLVALSYALSNRPAPDLLVLSSPGLGANVPAWQKVAALVLGKLAPTFGIPAGIDGPALSRDEAVGEAYLSDPLRTPKDTAKLGAVFLAEMERVQPILSKLSLPTYVFHGGADQLVPAHYSAPLGELENVTRKLYPTLRHETHNEPEKVEVIGNTIEWILSNLA